MGRLFSVRVWSRAARIIPLVFHLRQHKARFGRRPLLGIVGARWGPLGVHRLLAKWRLIDVLGFEPDVKECMRLREAQPFAMFEPLALGNTTQMHRLYITHHPGCSSLLEPNLKELSRYPLSSWYRVVGSAEVMVHRFDELYPQKVTAVPDFLQIDVQGFETRVLEGFGQHLDQVVGVQCEGLFRPLYLGESLLWDLRDLLDARGFTFRHLESRGAFEGEVVESEVWFTRRAVSDSPEKQSLQRIWEMMSFLPPAIYFDPLEKFEPANPVA